MVDDHLGLVETIEKYLFSINQKSGKFSPFVPLVQLELKWTIWGGTGRRISAKSFSHPFI
jgi:hypothetical protein